MVASLVGGCAARLISGDKEAEIESKYSDFFNSELFTGGLEPSLYAIPEKMVEDAMDLDTSMPSDPWIAEQLATGPKGRLYQWVKSVTPLGPFSSQSASYLEVRWLAEP